MLFFILVLSFCLRVIRKGLRKNSEIFVNLRRSSGHSMRERSYRWPLFLVFKSVPGCIEGIPGHYGMLRGIMGCSRVFWGCSGLFRGVPGVFRGVPGVFLVFRHPEMGKVRMRIFFQSKDLYLHFFRNKRHEAFLNKKKIWKSKKFNFRF